MGPKILDRRALTILLVLFAGGRAAADSTYVDHYRAAMAAHAAGDIAGFRDQLLRVGAMIGEQPGVNYNLACAAARIGDRTEALRRLDLYAASGLVRDAAADSDFVSLWNDPEFVQLSKRIRANGDSIGTARVAHRLNDTGMLPEDVAYDPTSRSLFVTSVRHGHVVEITAGGVQRELSDRQAPRGWGLFGACVDAPRHLLWTATGAAREAEGYSVSDSGRTGLVAWDLRTRTVAKRIEWPRDGHDRLLGDLTVGPDGTVFASDSPAGAVRVLAPGADTMTTLVPDHGLRGPQTPALSADGRRLYVADYGVGIAVVDIATGAHSYLPFAPGIGPQGIDGLYRLGNDLVAVQNGTNPNRVMRFRLDAAGMRILSGVAIESGTHRLGEPTHGVVVGRDLYFLANTGWDRVGDDGVMKAGGAPPLILRANIR